MDADSLTVPATGVQHPVTSDPELLPDSIEKLSLEFEYECHLPDDGDAWTSVGISNNVVYVTLNTPHNLLLTNDLLCETLLEIGCTVAAGTTNRLAAYWPIRDKFASLDVSRVDGARLTYYIPEDPSIVMSDAQVPGSILHAFVKTILLSPADANRVFANCIGFSDFFGACLTAQGITGVRSVTVDSNDSNSTAGLAVKNWTFGTPGSPGAAPYEWKKDVAAVEDPGIGGQNNDDPPSFFTDHRIIEFYAGDSGVPGVDWIIFDPSYGRSAWDREDFEFGPGKSLAALTIVIGDYIYMKPKQTDSDLGSELTFSIVFEVSFP